MYNHGLLIFLATIIDDADEYTGTVEWEIAIKDEWKEVDKSVDFFVAKQVYRAIIKLTPKEGYTLGEDTEGFVLLILNKDNMALTYYDEYKDKFDVFITPKFDETTWVNKTYFVQVSSTPTDNPFSMNSKGKTEDDLQYWVKLNAFDIGNTMVTQGLYQEVMGVNPSSRIELDNAGKRNLNFPVENVSWNDAVICSATG